MKLSLYFLLVALPMGCLGQQSKSSIVTITGDRNFPTINAGDVLFGQDDWVEVGSGEIWAKSVPHGQVPISQPDAVIYCNDRHHDEYNKPPESEPYAGDPPCYRDSYLWGDIGLVSNLGTVIKLSDQEYARLQKLRQAVVDEERRLAVKYGAHLMMPNTTYNCMSVRQCTNDHYEFHQQFLLIDRAAK